MIDINIALDPVNDGIVQKTEQITCISKGALIIATNGKTRFVSLERIPYELEGLADLSYSEFMGDTKYLQIFNANKIFNVGTGRFFVGSVLVMKNDDGELCPMTVKSVIRHQRSSRAGWQRLSVTGRSLLPMNLNIERRAI